MQRKVDECRCFLPVASLKRNCLLLWTRRGEILEMCDLHITTHFHIWYREKSQSGRGDKRFVDMFFLVPDEHHKNNINQHIIQNCMFSDWDAQSHEVQLPNHDYNNDKHARLIKGVWTQCIKIDIEMGESASIQDEQNRTDK